MGTERQVMQDYFDDRRTGLPPLQRGRGGCYRAFPRSISALTAAAWRRWRGVAAAPG